jgi:HlyD family secretion protein
MPVQRTERLLNLVISLLAATRFVSKEQIRAAVPQYADSVSEEAFERMFERDKDDLREMGIPLETGSNDPYFDDEIGYRIPKDAYALPEVTFDSEELAVLGLAARAWQQATLAGLEAGVGRGGLEVEHGRANAQKLIAQAEVDRQAAAREVQINRQMFARGVIPELELRRSEDALEKAEIAAGHARVEAALLRRELTFELGTRKQALDRQREVVRELQRQVAALELVSPVDGQVGQLLVAPRATVPASAPIVTVVDLGAFELEIRVPDGFARDLAIGMAAEIRAGAASFPGRVRSVSPVVVYGNVATRLELGSARPDGLRQNQRLGARILIEERANVLKIERGPFLETGGGNVAYFVEDGVAERRPIRTGAISLDAIELLSGARVGDRIVVSGADALGDAQRVRIAD